MTCGTYLYCAVAHSRRPAVPPTLGGLPHTGPVRLLQIDRGLWLVVADAPLARYGEAPLASRMSDLRWVSRSAVAHDAVIEAFRRADAVLPMKLFTIFASDERALEYAATVRATLDSLVARVRRHDEWGVRFVLGPKPSATPARATPVRARHAAAARSTHAGGKFENTVSGAQYLARKKAVRDDGAERAARARKVAADLCASLATHASAVRQRADDELGEARRGRALLLDATMLVPRGRASRFSAVAARQARALAPDGFEVVLTGPWPPYSFMKD